MLVSDNEKTPPGEAAGLEARAKKMNAVQANYCSPVRIS